MPKLTFRSFSKLNLYLKVLGLRKDSYHNIETVFERIDLYDKVVLESRLDSQIRIICRPPVVPQDSTNIAYRSARLLQEECGVNKGVNIKLIKRIPVGAGLGGGSSNAACVLLGLNKLWGLKLTTAELIKLAGKIGSDVAFFVSQAPFAIGSGRGEKIRCLPELNGIRLWHVLVVPKINVSTPLIYKKWDEKTGLTTPDYNVKLLISELCKGKPLLLDKVLFNSLEQVTIKLYPEVGRIKKELLKLGAGAALMSGSGSAVFGLVSSRRQAAALGRKLKARNSSWQVFVARRV